MKDNTYLNDTSYEYDNLSRLIKVYEKGELQASYSYNNAGFIEKIEYSNNTSENYTYNKASWITKLENKSDKYSEKVIGVYEYSYYADGNQLSSTNKTILLNGGYETKTTEYKYDSIGRLKEENDSSGKIISYEYDLLGNRVKTLQNVGNTIDTTVYEYGGANKLIKTIKKNNDSEEITEYNYDLNGNQIQMVTETRFATNSNICFRYDTYEYDGFNKLIKSSVEVEWIINEPEDPEDPEDSEDSEDPEDSEDSEDPEDPDPIIIIPPYVPEPEPPLIPIPTDPKPPIVTNSIGVNINSIESEGNGITYMYSYRPDGLRNTVEGLDNTTIHIWDRDNIVGEINNIQGNTSYVRGYNIILSIDKDINKRYYHHNGFMDTAILTDNQGQVTKIYNYDAFGNEAGISSDDKNPFRYRGEYYDNSTGTYYLRARYYNPVTGRFVTQDSHWNPSNMIYGDNPVTWSESKIPNITAIMQNGNQYVYSINNPIMYLDSNGESIVLAFIVGGMIIGGVVGGLYGNYKANQAGYTIQNSGWDYWKYPLGYGTVGVVAGGLAGWGAGVGYAALTVSSPWLLDPLTRGNIIENKLGGWGNNFPVIDKVGKMVNGIHQSVTSIKSIDLAAKSYQVGNNLYRVIMGYTNSLANFQTKEYGHFAAYVGQGTQKILEIAIPTGATQAQMEQINKAIAEAAKQGVEIIMRIIK